MLTFFSEGLKNQIESKFDSQMHEVEHSQYTLNIPLISVHPGGDGGDAEALFSRALQSASTG